MKVLLSLLVCVMIFSCSKKDKAEVADTTALNNTAYQLSSLPDNIKWETNNDEETWCARDVKKGGTFTTFMQSFPLTLRQVGPDSNGSFRSYIDSNQLSLVSYHPNTLNIIPSLATHWAYDKDGRTVYYKLDPDAKWSDGKPVTADDYLFALEFMRSPHIVAPWYNKQYTEEFTDLKKYDDYTISITGKTPRSKRLLPYFYGMSPLPKHFYKLDADFIKNYNWKIAPNTGPYQITDVNKGKHIMFTRKKDWWAKDKKYNINRYNVDFLKIVVIRELSIAYEYFRKGEIDSFSLTMPDYWHEKSKIDIFENGYAQKVWFFVDKPQPEYGIWMNLDKEIFKDINLRKAISHSINIDMVISSVLRGDYQRLHTGTTGYGKYTNTNIRAREFSLDDAEKYYKAAGWENRDPKDGIRIKDGKRLSLTITYGQEHHKDRMIIIKEEAKKAGLELNLQLLDPNAAFKTMLEKNHEIAYSGWSTSFVPQYWGQWHSENAHKPQTNNFSNTANTELDQLITQYDEEMDEEKAAKLAWKIQQIIHDDAAFIPTWLVPYFREGYWRWWKLPETQATRLSDSLFEPFDTSGGLFYLDEAEKTKTLEAMKKKEKFEKSEIINEKFKVYK